VLADLRRAGVGAGDCVAVWLPNWSTALAWQFAVSALGAHVIGINTRYNVDEVVHVLERARPKVVVLAHEFHGLDLIGRLRAAVARADAPPPAVVPVAGPHPAGPVDAAGYDVGGGAWTPTDPDPAADAPLPRRDGTDLAVAFTTSGSTGKPKLAAHREAAVEGHARDDARELGIRPGDVALCVLPLSGVFGFNTAMAAVAGGGACLFEPTFDAAATLGHMATHGATHVVGGDDMVSRLADTWDAQPVELLSLRWVLIADFIGRSADIAGWAERAGARMSGVYGSSEVFALALFWP
jgi:fatty-acyl-CoA synthase